MRWSIVLGGVVAAGIGGVAHAGEEEGHCEPRPACAIASGEGCLDAYEPVDTIFALEVESIDRTGDRVRRCAGRWLGERGCYTTQIAKDLSDLGLVAIEIAGVEARWRALPEVARRACEAARPALATRALGEVDGWCRVGQGECAGAIDLARIVLKGMDPWHTCVERMESRVVESARRAPLPCAREAAAVAVRPAPLPVAAPASEPTVTRAEPAPEPSVVRPLKVVEARPIRTVEVGGQPGSVGPSRIEAEPLAGYGPRPAPARPPEATALATTARAGASGATTTTSAQLEQPRAKTERRAGQVELSLAPFSGVLSITDPATQAEYEPLAASVALAVSVVASIASGVDLEIALTGRGTFASTALMDAATTGLDELDTESGSALVLQIEPAVTVLSRYVGVGIVTDFRWDSVGVSSITTGIVRTDSAGVAAGARFVVGLGLLASDLRLLGLLDYLFVGTDEDAVRVGLRAELGPALITGSYTRYAPLGEATDARVVDNLQLTLGFRMVF